MSLTRRSFIASTGAAALAAPFSRRVAAAETPLLTIENRILDVRGKAAKVFGIAGPDGKQGVFAREGERFSGMVRNATADPLILHWHGQIHAPADQDRSRPQGGDLAVGAQDSHDFLLTPGTHWMHSHQLTEQQLLAAPMITREKQAGDVRDIVLMLHDFAFRLPAEILAGLGGSMAHSGHGGMAHGAGSAGMPPHGMGARTRVHANDVAYDAYLANDRTLDDPEVIRVEEGESVRLRVINGATATAFFVDTGQVDATCIAVDGSPCQPLRGRRFPIAQGQRLDLVLAVPAEGGAFPLLAQVEADTRLTGIVLATAGATVARIGDTAREAAPHATLAFDERLRALNPLPARRPDRTLHLMLGEEAGYRWTINGKVHGEHQPLEARLGERIAVMFMNPTSMMHPMHLHGHHFQVVGSRAGQFSGPVRDTVIVPPHTPVMIAFDADKAGRWFLHCHHLYHMATGMMTELSVS